MADKMITGLDFQERNRQVEKKKKEITLEELKSTIISIVNYEWENTADKIVKAINLQEHLSFLELSFLNANKDEVANWSKEALKLILFKDEDYGYELGVPE